ncbi:flavin reductase family protein [Arthrobacter sp. B1805]|uniref:flavin reductase family protein n=1 Tax=Arthrobacter sp. B1805 TaxID=2058892 RepID=UPI000CE398B2|nr:flavin reductase family protein [Arthrobacter sp. B1805]
MTTTIGNPSQSHSQGQGHSQSSSIDHDLFRSTAGRYASGITIITGHHDQGPIGFTCQSFYSVSVNPPLVSFSVMKTSITYPRIRDTGSFTVNVLARNQEALSNQFARRGTDKWAGIPWSPTTQGNPIVEGSLAWFDCTIWAEHDAGDHLIVLGRVIELGTSPDRDPDPLLYFQGQYRALHELDPA